MNRKIHEESSMLYWWPKIKDLPIPKPKTLFYMIPPKYFPKIWMSERELAKMIRECIDDIKKIARRIGYPLFLRSDQASGKHNWKNTCYVPNENVLAKHCFEVLDFNLLADIFGLPFKALVFREYIPMNSKFKAFYGEMPISPERRYLIKNGKVIAHFPYWPPDAIEQGSPKEILPENWRQLLEEMNRETEEEVKLLTEYSLLVAEKFNEFWSIDYCQSKSGKWILIDMARGEVSWIPEKIKRKIK